MSAMWTSRDLVQRKVDISRVIGAIPRFLTEVRWFLTLFYEETTSKSLELKN